MGIFSSLRSLQFVGLVTVPYVYLCRLLLASLFFALFLELRQRLRLGSALAYSPSTKLLFGRLLVEQVNATIREARLVMPLLQFMAVGVLF